MIEVFITIGLCLLTALLSIAGTWWIRTATYSSLKETSSTQETKLHKRIIGLETDKKKLLVEIEEARDVLREMFKERQRERRQVQKDVIKQINQTAQLLVQFNEGLTRIRDATHVGDVVNVRDLGDAGIHTPGSESTSDGESQA